MACRYEMPTDMKNQHVTFALLLFLLSLPFTSGCTGIEKAPGKQTIRLTKPIHSDELEFSDDNINIYFIVQQRKIDFGLTNKTQGPIAIIWDEIILRDPEGATHWVINSAEDQDTVRTKTAHATTTHPHIDPSTIPAGASYNDYIKPFPSGFQDVLIYPLKYAGGSRIKLTLPLEIGGYIKVYTFGFEVVD
ncbi:MAG: hypothetical protein V3V54_00180 [Candidatus Brocadiales bacterium]